MKQRDDAEPKGWRMSLRQQYELAGYSAWLTRLMAFGILDFKTGMGLIEDLQDPKKVKRLLDG